VTRLANPDYRVDIFYKGYTFLSLTFFSLQTADYKCTGDELYRFVVLGIELLEKTSCTEDDINLTGHSVLREHSNR
jgi:hypothetical protein